MSQETSKVDSRIILGSTGYRFPSPYSISTVWQHPHFNASSCSGALGSTYDEGELPIFDRKIADLVYAG
jgi:hypothetical protein